MLLNFRATATLGRWGVPFVRAELSPRGWSRPLDGASPAKSSDARNPTNIARFCPVTGQLSMGRGPMRQDNSAVLARLRRLLQSGSHDVAHETLPERWIDLINYLNAKERPESNPREPASRERADHAVRNKGGTGLH